jgi:hypothetical protein
MVHLPVKDVNKIIGQKRGLIQQQTEGHETRYRSRIFQSIYSSKRASLIIVYIQQLIKQSSK